MNGGNFMKKIISMLLCATFILGMVLTTTVSAADTKKAEAFAYTLAPNGKEYSVCIKNSSGQIKFPATYKGLPVTEIKSGSTGESTVKSINIPDSVITIDDFAFDNFTELKSVSGAKNLKTIGSNAFAGCKKLTNVDLGTKVSSIGKDAFKNTSVKSKYEHPNLYIVDDYLISGTAKTEEGKIIIPEGVITIADNALQALFNNSDVATRTVILPKSLRHIGKEAFFEAMITQVQFPSKLLTIGIDAFKDNPLKNVKIPANVRSIGVGAFSDCDNIKVTVDSDNKYLKIINKVLLSKDGKIIYDNYGITSCHYKVPEGVVKIADKAFYKSGLTGVTIASTVKTIGYSAFEQNKKLKTVVIGKNVSNIGSGAFMDCTKLNSLTIKKGCKTIGDRMFAGCTALKSVTLPAGIKSVEYYAFSDCTSLSKVSLPSTLTFIVPQAFKNTHYLKNAKYTKGILYNGTNIVDTIHSKLDSSVTIKEGTTCIAGHTFSGIADETKIKKINFPEGLRYIGEYAFDCNEALNAVTIPASVKSVGLGAFSDCDNLNNVTIKGGATEIGKRSFGFTFMGPETKLTIHALKGSKAQAYANENGYNFKSIGIYLKMPEITTAKNTANGINIKWNEVKYAKGYRVFRKAPGETSWTHLKDVKGLSYTDTNVKNGKQYTYTVEAFNGKTFSNYNKTGFSHRFLSAPEITKIENAAKSIKLTWSKVSGADGYIVYKKTSASWKKIATISGVNTLNYYDKDIIASKTYTYTVKAYKGSLVSGYNTTGISIKRLLPPELLSATSTKTGITLKWDKVTGAGGYAIYRKSGNGKLVKLTTIKGVSKISYVDKSAKKGTTYSYQIKAYSGKTFSAYSNANTVKDKY